MSTVAKANRYDVAIYACVWYDDDGEWGDSVDRVMDASFDTYDAACEFARGITSEQALEWERQNGVRGIDILIYRIEYVVDIYGSHTVDSAMLGEREFIDGDENGCWL